MPILYISPTNKIFTIQIKNVVFISKKQPINENDTIQIIYSFNMYLNGFSMYYEVRYEPGKYKLKVKSWVKSGMSVASKPVRDIKLGDCVTVTDVQTVSEENRIRGRISDGWITLYNLSKQKPLVDPVDEKVTIKYVCFSDFYFSYTPYNTLLTSPNFSKCRKLSRRFRSMVNSAFESE